MLGTTNTPELQDHCIEIIIKHIIQTEFYTSLKHETKECTFAAQEAHTSPKSHHKLNIWQMISLLKVRVLKPIHTQQVTNYVSIKIKALI
jgi:hypothetical protein